MAFLTAHVSLWDIKPHNSQLTKIYVGYFTDVSVSLHGQLMGSSLLSLLQRLCIEELNRFKPHVICVAKAADFNARSVCMRIGNNC